MSGEANQFSVRQARIAKNRRCRLLFIAKPFPPAQVAACTRTWNMAKYLSRLGWEVTVVTLRPSIWRRVDNPEETAAKIHREGIKRILTDHPWRFLRPQSLKCCNSGTARFAGAIGRMIARRMRVDSNIGWIKGVNRACSTLTKGDADIILATGSPFASFMLAKELSMRIGCPYVLDYRDPWTENPHKPNAARPDIVQEERRLVGDSAAVTIVSPSWGEALDRRFAVGSRLHVISNGYDPEELASIKPYDFGHFAIVYAGNFYPPKRVISPVMTALKRLAEIGKGPDREWFFHYYGHHERHVFEEAKRFGVAEKVISHGWVPRSEALAAVRGAGLVVVISSVDEDASVDDRGIMTGKVYEALGLKTPVLLVAPKGSDLEMLAEGKSRVKSFAGSSVEDMSVFIRQMMSGAVSRSEADDPFAWPTLAKELDRILRWAIRTQPNRLRVESSAIV